MPRRIGRWVFTLIGSIAGLTGFYTLSICVGDVLQLIRLRSPKPPALPLNGPEFMVIGGIYFLDLAIFAIATLVLFAIAVWGIEPRKRWREYRGVDFRSASS